MDDDEEVVLKNSGLYTCLIEAGFHDFESVEKSNSFDENTENEDSAITSELICDNDENWQEYEYYIQQFLQSKLVFEDDASFVQNCIVSINLLVPNFSRWNVLKFASYPLIMGIAFNACRLVKIKIRPNVFVGFQMIPLAGYCIRRAFCTYKSYRRKKYIHNLLSSLKELSLFTQKSVQFVVQNSALSFGRDKHCTNSEDDAYFRETIFDSLKLTILEIKSVISSLVKNFPLKEPFESQQYYLAFLSDENLHCVKPDGALSSEYLQKMKYTYFLLQSEFLRRVCLCFVPCLQRTRMQTPISSLFDELQAISHSCSLQCQRLKSVFELYYLFKKPNSDSRTRKTRDNWKYKEAYVKICSLSFNLQSVLRESRRIEQILEDINIEDDDYGRIIDSLDCGSQRIQTTYKNCQHPLDDFVKYAMSLRPQRDPESICSMLTVTESNKTNIMVGVTDFSPHWPDEVFVGVSEANAMPTEASECDDGVSPVCSKLLINELKMALRDKAKEWKERERVALKNKNVDETSDCDDDELPVVRKERRIPRIHLPVENQNLPSFSESSLAKQIAAASASWHIREEQHFCLGEDDTDDNDESS